MGGPRNNKNRVIFISVLIIIVDASLGGEIQSVQESSSSSCNSQTEEKNCQLCSETFDEVSKDVCCSDGLLKSVCEFFAITNKQDEKAYIGADRSAGYPFDMFGKEASKRGRNNFLGKRTANGLAEIYRVLPDNSGPDEDGAGFDRMQRARNSFLGKRSELKLDGTNIKLKPVNANVRDFFNRVVDRMASELENSNNNQNSEKEESGDQELFVKPIDNLIEEKDLKDKRSRNTFLGKRSRNTFLGKRSRNTFLGKRARNSFLGK